jgi:ubiquinone biosynthesis protein UbiJ
MPATPVWLAAAEAVLNRSIQAHSQAGRLAGRLERKTLEIDVTGLIRLRAGCHGGRLALSLGEGPAADAVITGSPAALLALMTGAARAAGGVPGGAPARVSGDADTAAAYRDLLRAARPDFEEELARLVGDVPARHAATLARGTFEWASRAGRRFGENIAEYLQEESRDLVNKTELAEFLRGVDELREASDRVEARLRRLERLSSERA